MTTTGDEMTTYNKIVDMVLLKFQYIKQVLNRAAMYQHFKGGYYVVLADSILESDTSIKLVTYMGEDGRIWTRPHEEFYGVIDGVDRFSLIRED